MIVQTGTITANKKSWQTTAILLFCALFLSYQSPSPQPASPLPGAPLPGSRQPASLPVLPAALQEQLRGYRLKDDLAGWIYCQVQWVAKAPAARAASLSRATATAWRSPRNNEEIQAWQDLLSNEGYALLISGDIVRSTDAYTAAFQWARQHSEIADESLVLDNILKPLGNNYTRLGDYEQALFIHHKALAIAANLEDKKALAGTYSNLANAYSSIGLPGQSLDYCRQGLAIVDNHSALGGLLLSEQADAFQQLQQPEAALASIRKSISVLEQALNRERNSSAPGIPVPPMAAAYWLQTAYQQAGDLCAAQPGSTHTALKWYLQASVLQNGLLQQQGTLRRRERAKLFQRLGALFYRSNQPDRSAYWLDQCLSVLIPGKKIDSLQEADLYAENTLMDLLFTRAGLCRQQQQTDKALRLYALCFLTEKKLRQELISGSSKERSVADSRLRYEEALAVAWGAWESTQDKKYRQTLLAFMESSKSQLLLEELRQQQYRRNNSPGDSLSDRVRLLERAQAWYEKEALEKNDSLSAVYAAQAKQVRWDLSRLSPATGPPPSFCLDSLQALLAEGQTVRSFFTGTKAMYIVECDRHGISFADKLPLDGQWQDSVRVFIHTWFERGAGPMIDHSADYCRQAYTLYRELFGRHPLLPGKEYILLPDGAINILPVEALVTQPACPATPEKWPFVIQQTPISYAWSLQTLRQQMIITGQGSGFSGFFLSGNGRSSPLLNATRSESAGIQQLVKNGDWYMDEEATTGAFRKALSRSAIVHISSHAYTKRDSVDAPHIELFNEPFYLFELKGLEHHPALVVLSACRTGDGKPVTGEGVQSLARAFTAGGTNAVVAGWWNVNDETAARLVQGFYSILLAGPPADRNGRGINVANALHTAKLDWLKNPAIPYLHKLPYYWAALNYQGNPAPLPAGYSRHNGAGGNGQPVAWWWLVLALPVGVIVLLALFSPVAPPAAGSASGQNDILQNNKQRGR